jgi:hypothetical protein
MNYTEQKKTFSVALIPKIKKRIAYNKLRRGRPVSRLTKKIRSEIYNKKEAVNEAKRLMAQTTPCADDAVSQNLSLDDILYESDEYIEYNACGGDVVGDGEQLLGAVDDDGSEDDCCEDDDTCKEDDIDKCDSEIENNEKCSSPIHMYLLDNELEYDKTVCLDTINDTSDPEYKDVISNENENENNIFKMDEELDIIDSDFQFIN